MDTINIAILLGLLLIALAITIIKLELVFRSVLSANKEGKLPAAPLTSMHGSEEKSQHTAK